MAVGPTVIGAGSRHLPLPGCIPPVTNCRLGQTRERCTRRLFSGDGAHVSGSGEVNASSRLGDESREPTVRLPDWSELVASYSRMKSAWGCANGGQPILVCYIRKYVIILGGIFPLTSPQPKYWGCPRHSRRRWRQWCPGSNSATLTCNLTICWTISIPFRCRPT